jgi:hypothetical protein
VFDTMRSFPEGPWDPAVQPRGLAWDEVVTNNDLDRISFVMDAPEIGPGQVRFTVWAVNDTDQTAALVVSGFGLQPRHLQGPRFVGAHPVAPAPPLNLQIQIPSRSRVAFGQTFTAEDWAFDGVPFDFNWMLMDHQHSVLAHGSVAQVRVTS